MSTVGSVGGSGGGFTPQTAGIGAATALTLLRKNPSLSVTISDSTQNIVKNLDALQKVQTKITSLTTTDVNKKMTVSGVQFQNDAAIIAKFGAGSGQTIGVTGMAAVKTANLASYVTSVTVLDTTANIQTHLDRLQTLTTSGLLTQVTQAGATGNLTLTAAQVVADQGVLGIMKNGAYTLSVTNASVDDALGLGSNPALATNAKVKQIAIVDSTANIHDHLDDLQKIGLRIKSIAQTDASTTLAITGAQYVQDKLVLGKFITADHLALQDAASAQLRTLHADHKVISIAVTDTALNLSKNWALLQSLEPSLTSVKVSNQTAAISITGDQLADGATLLSKFEDSQAQSYKLAVTSVSASSAVTAANTQHVETIEVADTGANIAASMDDLQAVDALGKLKSITLGTTAAAQAMSMDVARMQGSQLDATQSVLDKIKRGGYQLSITGASATDLNDLASNRRVAAVTVSDSSTNIKSALNTLYHLGGRLTKIEQTDSGTALDLTQSQFDSRAAVLSKIVGGYTANLTEVSAAKAVADARNVHVTGVSVTDTGKNILANWSSLLSMGTNLDAIAKSDNGVLTLSAGAYQQGLHDDLIAKFGQATEFAITGASLTQAQALVGDQAVTKIDIADSSGVIATKLGDLSTLLAGGKLNSITNQSPSESLSFDVSELAGAQDVLDTIKGGNYTLALRGVDAGDAKDLLAANHKIASVAVSGDAASIVSNLSDLAGLGKKLSGIARTDTLADELEMTGTAFEMNASTLAKIDGGFVATLTDVSAAKAAAFGANNAVSSIAVSDTGAHLASSWRSLDSIGDKLTAVAQSDSSALQLTVGDWLDGQTLRGKFDSDPTVSVSGVAVADIDDLLTDDAVQSIQVSDTSSAVADALNDLASQSKLTQIVLANPTVAMSMSGATYQASSALLALVKNHQFTVELDDVSAQDGATLASDAHVTSMDVNDTGAAISTHFSALAAASNLNSLTLSDEGGTLTLTSAQILDNPDPLAAITNSYELVATGVTMEQLIDIEDMPQVSSIRISDTAQNVSENFGDVLALGNQLGQLHLSDTTPVLTLTESDWTAGSTALSLVDGAFQVDVTDAVSGDAQTLAANSTVLHVAVADNAANIAGNWDTLVALYNDGAGKLNGLSLTNSDPLTLTTDQQTTGATMIADLLAGATIETAA